MKNLVFVLICVHLRNLRMLFFKLLIAWITGTFMKLCVCAIIQKRVLTYS